jgi:hypothetical protein
LLSRQGAHGAAAKAPTCPRRLKVVYCLFVGLSDDRRLFVVVAFVISNRGKTSPENLKVQR